MEIEGIGCGEGRKRGIGITERGIEGICVAGRSGDEVATFGEEVARIREEVGLGWRWPGLRRRWPSLGRK